MGRQRGGRAASSPRRQKTGASSGPVAGIYDIDTGTCELLEDDYLPDGWVLEINGVPSSHIDLNDPTLLEFEYMRWIAMLVESRFASDSRLRALHLGGGACTMARYFAATFPEARQVVVEIDGRLAELVRHWFDLPRAPRLRIRVGEARQVLTSLSDGTRDVIVRDVFAYDRTPIALTTVQFTRHAHRVLAPGGVYVVNCGDFRDLATARREATTIGSVFAHTALIADPAMIKGRRYGNIVLAGSDAPLGDSPALARDLLGGAVPAKILVDDEVQRFAAGAPVLDDSEAPPPPTPKAPAPKGGTNTAEE
ncbi:fused MFS/spermidine synthase [Rhodococcus sp. Z13]|uniref:Fused MFS/spermidine synthase n=1 Tax=Rhodococcus sacchari TaxID=2962047 RepID=A0ACD4DG22_9NOCA|nr:fused MFS/spermidine synthase [Rhodococcus sp. Z13]UYP18984.1 fused MFS/spermidine synthase [Rhodococcus sp. Z13]